MLPAYAGVIPADPFKITQSLKIPIEYEILPEKIKGYITYPVHRRVIVLNKNMDPRETIVVLTHELGHAVMHTSLVHPFHAESVNYRDAHTEYEANLFAFYFLAAAYGIDESKANRLIFFYNMMDPKEAHTLLCQCVP